MDKDKRSNNVMAMEQGHDSPDIQTSQDLMEYALNHYITHHKVVLKKLQHAQEATKESIAKLDKISEYSQRDKDQETLQDVKKYDGMWRKIIALFRRTVGSDDDLNKIEDVLSSVPKVIKYHYDILIAHDKILQEMITTLDSEKYKRISRIIEDIQKKPNQMSNLGPEIYETQEISAYKIFRKFPTR